MPQQKLDFFTPGVLIDDIPASVFLPLQDEIKEIESNFENATKVNETLVGHIKHEYDMPKSKKVVDEYIQHLLHDYNREMRQWLEFPSTVVEDAGYVVDRLWVNFQKKHEFNPPHDHVAAMSFVIWMQVPYTLDEEEKIFNQARRNQAGKFGFLYTDTLGKIQDVTLPVDKTWQGKIALFPGSMYHWVSPFYTSDEFRISVAGNVKLSINADFRKLDNSYSSEK